MMKVMVGGTFDVLHEGHRFFLTEAKKQGDKLIVVVARDSHVLQFKSTTPFHNEAERVKAVQSTGIADEVVLGKQGSIFDILSDLKPDVVCLGYDQGVKEDALKAELHKRHLNSEIIRLSAFKPDIYKSSKIRETLPKH